MILSVSRRCDIPNYYFEWFLRRMKDGFLYVRNPMNSRQVSKIILNHETVDGICFWTKNPASMLPFIEALDNWPYYIQWTLNGYGPEIEPGLPDKKTVLIPRFCRLAQIIGSERLVWRYDPIFFSRKYTWDYHLKTFEATAEALKGHTKRVVISFLDMYAKMKKQAEAFGMYVPETEILRPFAHALAQIAEKNGMEIFSCAEELELSDEGISRGSCIDRRLMEKIIGAPLKGGTDKAQRGLCRCMESIDVGAYDSCPNQCRYCYANAGCERVLRNFKSYDPAAPVLCSVLVPEDKITVRKMKSLKVHTPDCPGQMLLDLTKG